MKVVLFFISLSLPLSSAKVFAQNTSELESSDIEISKIQEMDLLRKKFFPRIWQTSQLNFGMALIGDGEKTVLPTHHNTPENGSFLIFGVPFKHLDILLPKRAYLRSVRGHSQIEVSRFQSYPAAHFRISPIGFSRILVGATRHPCPATLSEGQYRGNYMIELISQ